MFLPIKDHNPTRTTPYVTVALIALNSLVFLVELGQGSQLSAFIGRWGATPAFLVHGRDLIAFTGTLPASPPVAPAWITAFTSMFLHGGFLHLFFNMLYLWIFGNNVEDFLGHLHFLIFYLVTGLAGVAGHTLLNPDALVPVIGASGAISGVLGAYMVLYPHARVTTLVFLVFFVTFIQVPAVLLLGLWIFIQVMAGVGTLGARGGGGTAHWAHIGGFVAGYLYLRLGPGRPVVARRNAVPVPGPPPPPPRVGGTFGGDPIRRFLEEIERENPEDED